MGFCKKRFFMLALAIWLSSFCLAQGAQTATEKAQESGSTEAQISTLTESGLPQKSELEKGQEDLLNSHLARTLDFPLELNGVQVLPLEFHYDLSALDELKIGPSRLGAKNFLFALINGSSLKSQFNKNTDFPFLVGTWPLEFIRNGQIEIVSPMGEVFYSHAFNEKTIKEWQTQFSAQDPRELGLQNSANQNRELVHLSFLQFSNFGFPAEALIKKIQPNTPFRICLENSLNRQRTVLCTALLSFDKKSDANAIELVSLKQSIPPRVFINQTEGPLTSVLSLGKEQNLQFFAQLRSGMSLEFFTSPPDFKILHFFKSSRDQVVIEGEGAPPLGAKIIHDKNKNIWEPWQHTFGNTQLRWQLEKAPENNLWLDWQGVGGGLFRQKLILTDVPAAKNRIFLKDINLSGVSRYKNRISVFHHSKSKITKVSEDSSKTESNEQNAKENPKSSEQEAATDKKQQNTSEGFTSKQLLFLAPNEFNYNSMDVALLDGDGKRWTSRLSLYRAPNHDFSARLSTVAASNNKSLLLGEGSLNFWFQDLWGWQNDYLSNKRWGLGIKQFLTLSSLEVKDSGEAALDETSELTALNLDLKYRILPGQWGLDESYGVLLGYQELGVVNSKAPMLGLGVFWGRSLPKLLDDAFNLIPFFKKPKYVDLEFIFYPSALKSNITMGSTFSLNFHGKVLFTPRLFGELGFGLRSYDYQDFNNLVAVGLTSFYLTLGLGVHF